MTKPSHLPPARVRQDGPSQGSVVAAGAAAGAGAESAEALCEVRVNFPDADFWIVRRGTPEAVGAVTTEFSREHIGVRVLAPEVLLPGYLKYFMQYQHSRGFFRQRAIGSLRLVNIRLEDVRAALRTLRTTGAATRALSGRLRALAARQE